MVQPGVSALGKKNSTTVWPRKSFRETFFPSPSGKVKSGALSLISMAGSPFRPSLYRTTGGVVIWLALVLLQMVPAQVGRRPTASKGPRALGLLELAANGKARLIPVTIMYDGKFYDASAYKASPVPLALESETVYEAVRNGVSEGLFTVTRALQGNHTWIGQGSWQSASAIAAAAAKKNPSPSKPAQDLDAPPVLRRAGAERARPPTPTPPATPGQTEPQASPSAPSNSAPSAASIPAPATAGAPAVPAVVEEDNDTDKDRPALRRGQPPRKSRELAGAPVGTPVKAGAPRPAAASAASSAVQIIPAISDADGPEPHPYTYPLKPEEEPQFRMKMLALAGDEVRARARLLGWESGESSSSAPSARRQGRAAPAVKLPQPRFEDLELRVFDLSNSNQPVLVLTTRARIPPPSSASADMQYYLTLVAHADLYGELRKAFSQVTDMRHLDVLPRLELIDAVDADGDGRGELLFRQVSDAGTAFSVYRVLGDQLWPLFQGTPGH
jgi:hypothetical protein